MKIHSQFLFTISILAVIVMYGREAAVGGPIACSKRDTQYAQMKIDHTCYHNIISVHKEPGDDMLTHSADFGYVLKIV